MIKYGVSAFRPTVTACRTIIVAFAVLLTPAVLFAQQATAGRTEVGGDLRWLTGVQFNDVTATETAFGGAPRTVFRSSSQFEQAACAEGRVVVRLTSVLDAEGSIAFGRTQLTTEITQDPEASAATISEPLSVYLLEAGIAAHLTRWHRGRIAPFATAGIGFLRQLHDHRTLVENGRTFYVGGGLRYPLSDDTRGLKSAALRLELRATILPGASTLDAATHVLPAVMAGVLFHL